MTRLVSIDIRTQLLLLAFIVAIPAACIIVYSGIQTRNDAIHDARVETQRLVANIAAEQQNLINSAQQLSIALAQLPEVKRHNSVKVESILRDILKLNTQYSNIFIADLKGWVWASAVPTKPPFVISDRRYFKNALASGQLSSGEFVISRATTHPVFNISYPLKNDRGTLEGIISVGLDLRAFKEVLERAKLSDGANFVLLDHKGIVLYRAVGSTDHFGKPYDPALFKLMQESRDEDTFFGISGFTGKPNIITYRKLRLPGEQEPYMYVRAGILATAALADANKMLIRNLSLFTAFLLLAIHFAWLVGKRSIADRITLLEKASKNLAAGNLNVRVSDLVSGGELGRLGQTFDAMASQLLQREQALVESERNYRQIFNTTTDAIMVHDVESGNIIEINKTVEEMYGYSREEILNQHALDLRLGESPYSMQDALKWIHKAFAEGPQHFEWRSKKKNGDMFWTEVVLSPTRIGGERRVLAVVRDITERKRAQVALTSQNLKNETILSAASDGIHILDIDGNVLQTNEAFCRMLGYTVDEMKNMNVSQWDVQWSAEELKERIPNQMNKHLVFETKHRRSDNRVIDVEISSVGVEIAGKPMLFNSARDITERKHLEEQLRQSQKMESIGILAGGVAHDFNNILSAIVGYGYMAQMMLKEDPKTRGYIDEMLASANRAAELTRGLLAFSRKQVIKPLFVDLNDILRNIDKMLRRIIGEDIELSTVLSSRKLPVLVDVGQMEQVLMNLVTNARDAMPDGGHLTIKTDMVNVDSHYAETHFSQNAGTYVVLTVSDTGVGMDQGTKKNIFEPFFTTKAVGKGTGLGLSMVYGIVKQHNGNMRVYSEEGKGTIFKIYLPIAAAHREALSEPKIDTLPVGKGETIIIAEDEQHIRTSMKLILQDNGYKIIEAENGEEAVKKFKDNKGTVSLILLDVIMPVKNGREAYEEIKDKDPAVKTIFMSGYSDDIISKKGLLEESFDLISKPINPDTLMRKIREVLDR